MPVASATTKEIALADGLAHAEIARRLDRPTSTITREAMRNARPTAYPAAPPNAPLTDAGRPRPDGSPWTSPRFSASPRTAIR